MKARAKRYWWLRCFLSCWVSIFIDFDTNHENHLINAFSAGRKKEKKFKNHPRKANHEWWASETWLVPIVLCEKQFQSWNFGCNRKKKCDLHKEKSNQIANKYIWPTIGALLRQLMSRMRCVNFVQFSWRWKMCKKSRRNKKNWTCQAVAYVGSIWMLLLNAMHKIELFFFSLAFNFIWKIQFRCCQANDRWPGVITAKKNNVIYLNF